MNFEIRLQLSKRFQSSHYVNNKVRYKAFNRLVKKIDRGEFSMINVRQFFIKDKE